MKRLTISSTVLLVVLLLGVAAGTASASKNRLDLTWNGEEHQLAAGEAFDMVLTDPGLTLEAEPDTASCSAAPTPGYAYTGLEGTVLTNNSVKDQLELNASAGGFAVGGAKCSSTSNFLFGEIENVSVFPTHNDLKLRSRKGTVELNAKPPATALELFFSTSEGAQCWYDARNLKGTLTLEPHGVWDRVGLRFAHQTVKRTKGFYWGECPKTVTISAAFRLQAHGNSGFGSGSSVFGHLD